MPPPPPPPISPKKKVVTRSPCGNEIERKLCSAGLAEYFRNSSEEEREHAEKLMIQQVRCCLERGLAVCRKDSPAMYACRLAAGALCPAKPSYVQHEP